MYKLTNSDLIIRLSDFAWISPEPTSIDYQTYQDWLKQGNTPEPADPIVEPAPLTPEQKLQNAGLTIDELKSLLGLQK